MEARLQLVKDGMAEDPEIQGHRRVAGDGRVGFAVLGERRVVSARDDLRALHDAQKMTVLIHRAHAAGNRAVGRHGVAQAIAHHGVRVGRAGLVQEADGGLIRVRAVEIVGVDDDEIARRLPVRAQRRVTRAPRLLAPLGNPEARGQEIVQRLVRVGHLDKRRHAAADRVVKQLLALGLDDENNPFEARADRVVNGIIDDQVPGLVHRRYLLLPRARAEAAAQTRGHDHQRMIHANTLLVHGLHFSYCITRAQNPHARFCEFELLHRRFHVHDAPCTARAPAQLLARRAARISHAVFAPAQLPGCRAGVRALP